MYERILAYARTRPLFQTHELVRARVVSAAEACRGVKALLADGKLVYSYASTGQMRVAWLTLAPQSRDDSERGDNMCVWVQTTRSKFQDVVARLSEAGRSFSPMTVRDELRKAVGGTVDVRYGDVFSELWHYYRKGHFAQQYLIRTLTVLANGKPEISVEYVPATSTVLKKVLEQWVKDDLHTTAQAPAVSAILNGVREDD